MIAAPLRLSPPRTVIALLLVLFGLQQVRFVIAQGYGDWSAFWAAGATAGTSSLLDPALHAAWQRAQHLETTIFPYLPGFAWFWYPFKPLALSWGYAFNFALMSIAGVFSGLLAARMYRIHPAASVLLIFAWAPAMSSLATGQNSLLGLLLCFVAILGLLSNSAFVAGLAVGALLYKIPYAVPFIILLAARREIRALGIVVLWACVWYLISATATGSDWQWPVHYASALRGYFSADFHQNAIKAISIPGLLMRAGLPDVLALAFGALLLVVAIPLLVRAPALEAASFTPLLAIAVGPHILPYDAVLALPALLYLFTHVEEPLRTRFMAAFYLIAPVWFFTGYLHFDVLAVLCDGLALAWIVKGYNESTARAHLGIAHSGDRGQA